MVRHCELIVEVVFVRPGTEVVIECVVTSVTFVRERGMDGTQQLAGSAGWSWGYDTTVLTLHHSLYQPLQSHTSHTGLKHLTSHITHFTHTHWIILLYYCLLYTSPSPRDS